MGVVVLSESECGSLSDRYRTSFRLMSVIVRPVFAPLVGQVMEAPAAGVLDVLRVPAGLPPGEYVLGWR